MERCGSIRAPLARFASGGALVAACAALLSLGACASFSSSSEGEPSDAGSDPSSSTDGGRTNLLTNGDFNIGCAGWTAANGTLTPEAVGRSGLTSCRVCANADVNFAMYSPLIRVPVVAGATYVAEVYLRAAPGKAAATFLTVAVDLSPSQPGPVTSGPELDETWKSISAVIVLDGGSGTGELSLRVLSLSIGTCFLIDDATLYLAQ
jgi:hypothetical protein